MDAATRNLVRRRAGNRCEYCLLQQEQSGLSHHIEHIVAKQHGGPDDPVNLTLACNRCNASKGPNLTGIDPETGEVVSLSFILGVMSGRTILNSRGLASSA